MKLLAHLTAIDGIRKEQTLKEHCFQTAEYASECLKSENLYHAAQLAGFIHDMGKAKSEYQLYLEDAFQGKEVVRGSVNHTFAGVIWLFERYHGVNASPWERLSCEVIGYAIGSHHGMFDCVDMDGGNGFLHRLTKEKEEIAYEESMTNFFSQVISEKQADSYFERATEEVKAFFQSTMEEYQKDSAKVYFQTGLLVRLLLSAVAYGDRRDTGEFMSQKGRETYREPNWSAQRLFLENKMAGFDRFDALNQVRSHISEQCLNAAERPGGIYRLSVPTGGGKTLAGLRYALAHAEKYGKKRIIFIIPLLSILDQNAGVIRESILDQNLVLEHHSNLVREQGSDGEKLDEKDLLAESWNGAPIIISTLVQLLNILFSSQMSAVTRMQALCDSVIVIDEIQSLPGKVTAMFNMAMNFLQKDCHATVILSSATQPCFENVDWNIRFADHGDLVCLTDEQKSLFRRAEIVDLTDAYGMDLDAWDSFCKELMDKHLSLLVICNTKEEARNLYDRAQNEARIQDWDVFHLSTSMCQAHRKEILEEIQKKLGILQERARNGESVRKLLCVSTQLVEAGIDFSFEAVVRVLAGIDNLAQAAGRCNRSNEYGCKGTVYLVKLKNENLRMLPDIRKAQACTMKLLQFPCEENLIGEKSARKYYEYWFHETKGDLRYRVEDQQTVFYLADLLGNRHDQVSDQDRKHFLLHQPFRWAGDEFQVFEENTTDILVPWRAGKHFIEKLRQMGTGCFDLDAGRRLMQQAKPYVVSIYEWQIQKLDLAGMLEPLLDGKILALNELAYDGDCGLRSMDEQKVENFIF